MRKQHVTSLEDRQPARLWEDGRAEIGLTLIELSIVLAVIVILSGIVAITVTGSSTLARGTTKSTDVREVQKAVNAYHALHPQEKWPTAGKQIGGQAIPSGGLPTVAFDPSNAASFVAIDWTATFTTTLDGARSLVPNMLSRPPKHGVDTTMDADGDGIAEQSAPTPVWVLGSDGVVHVLLNDAAY